MRAPLLLFLLSLLSSLAAACRGAEVREGAPLREPARVELVESEPIETPLDRAEVPNAAEVWLAMIDGAKRTLDIASFYASEAEPQWRSGSRLTAVIDAILRAAARGVRVRFLADAKLAKQYPETLGRFAARGVAVRRVDVEARAGGVMHAKYFVVDGVEAYVGSQNFDWRALSHIQELGVRVRSPELAGVLLDVFDTDWELAAGAPETLRVHHHEIASRSVLAAGGERLSLVASPRGWLPDEGDWDLPRLVAMLDGARRSVHLQVLTYKTRDRAGEPFPTLDDALRRALARGVAVRVLVSEWGSKGDALAAVLGLAAAGADARAITIPRWSGGEIPFSRVAHAKYLVVDGASVWIGTSNWEGDYFTRSRNVGVIAEGGALPGRVARFFDDSWSSPLVSRLGGAAPPAPSARPSGSDPAPP